MKVRIEFELPESCEACPIKCKWYSTNTRSESCPLYAYVVSEQSEQQTQPEQPTQNQDFQARFLGCTLRDIMLKVNSSRVTSYAQGGVVGCPSDYNFFGSGYNCSERQTRSCTACWDQVYTGYRKAGYTS